MVFHTINYTVRDSESGDTFTFGSMYDPDNQTFQDVKQLTLAVIEGQGMKVLSGATVAEAGAPSQNEEGGDGVYFMAIEKVVRCKTYDKDNNQTEMLALYVPRRNYPSGKAYGLYPETVVYLDNLVAYKGYEDDAQEKWNTTPYDDAKSVAEGFENAFGVAVDDLKAQDSDSAPMRNPTGEDKPFFYDLKDENDNYPLIVVWRKNYEDDKGNPRQSHRFKAWSPRHMQTGLDNVKLIPEQRGINVQEYDV